MTPFSLLACSSALTLACLQVSRLPVAALGLLQNSQHSLGHEELYSEERLIVVLPNHLSVLHRVACEQPGMIPQVRTVLQLGGVAWLAGCSASTAAAWLSLSAVRSFVWGSSGPKQQDLMAPTRPRFLPTTQPSGAACAAHCAGPAGHQPRAHQGCAGLPGQPDCVGRCLAHAGAGAGLCKGRRPLPHTPLHSAGELCSEV